MSTLDTYNAKLSQILHDKPVILQILKFAAIGTLNTALDFIILNYLTKQLGITEGYTLGVINIAGFGAAIIQSYLWNKAWAFAAGNASPFQNAFRLACVGAVGFFSFLAVVIGAANKVSPNFYLLLLIILLVAQLITWYGFHLKLTQENNENAGKQFFEFVIVSVVGLIINSSIVAVVSWFLADPLTTLINNEDLIKNLAKAMATGVSLIWNFIAYKLLVFKK
ncbi:MAG: GtrA family protein [Candidatus Doudnabacteria bacterium]